MSQLDCIIVGFNEIDFADFARAQQAFADTSGAYRELLTNSVLLGDRRMTYMDLLNVVRERETGRPSRLSAFEMPSLGVAYLASFLYRRGFDVGVVNFFNKGRDEFAAMLAEGPRAVAITTTYYVDDEPIRQIVRFVREHDETVPIIVGGPRIHNLCTGQQPIVQDVLLRAVGADIYINEPQGESTLAGVLATLRDGGDLSAVPNLIYRSPADRPGMSRTARKPESNNLDENAVDWSYFDPSYYTPTTYMRTSRSCSFGCAFCNYPSMAGPLTLSELSTIERELTHLCENGVQNMIFVDDTFNVPLPRFKKILRMMIDRKLDLRWVSFFRCSNADDEAFDLMAEAGCLGVFLGIESGDQQILKNMTKFAKTDRYEYGIEQLTSRGMVTLASIVLGFPGETEKTVRNTLDFVNRTRPTFFNVQLYYHDVLAPIERQRELYGIEGSGYSWKHYTMSWQEAADWKDDFVRNVTGSSLMPLYGLSIWAIPYLLSNGLTMDQITRFTRAATDLVVQGLDADHVDPEPAIAHVSRALAGVTAG
ncbi:PhpK family radical SAM P-methyltransferase [Micromonospora echinospora]|uniref:PhpK family radical SAM P-methyltransferase n=1 Tax=Micromonospora echinospora TaxID=1877 RepID=UPI00340F2227